MDIIKIFGAGIVVAIVAATVGGAKKEYEAAIVLCGGALILSAVMPGLKRLIENVTSASERAGINASYVAIVVKCSAVACIASICASICRDMGESAVASKIELAGRVSIMVTALPAINALLELIEKVI